MLKLRSNINGVQALNFIHGFRHLLLYSTSSSISTQVNSGFANYLADCLGFSKQQALSTSNKLVNNRIGRGAKKVSEFYFIDNANSVITFFKKIGLEQSQIRTAVVSEPQILLCSVDRTLIPKTKVLNDMGFSGSDFAEIVMVNSSIFMMGLDSSIVPAIQALIEIMGSEQLVIKLLKKSGRLRLSCVPKILVPNVALLKSYGVPIELIRKCLLRSPYTFFRSVDVFEDALVNVEEKLGIARYSPQFLAGVVLFTSVREETIELKRKMFKSFGWTDSDIATLSSLSPFILALSEATIKKKLDFLMIEMGYEASYISKRCFLLTCSLEKRIWPRNKILNILKEKGLIMMDYPLVSSISMPESRFLKKFVLPFKEVHEVYSQYTGISLELLTLGSSKTNSNAT